MPYHQGRGVFDHAHTWKYRVLLASHTHDPMGTLVKAVLGRNMATGIAYGLQARTDLEGNVRANMRMPGHAPAKDALVGGLTSVRDEFRRLADHCKLSDSERTALFDELRKWCGEDARVLAGIEPDKETRTI